MSSHRDRIADAAIAYCGLCEQHDSLARSREALYQEIMEEMTRTNAVPAEKQAQAERMARESDALYWRAVDADHALRAIVLEAAGVQLPGGPS